MISRWARILLDGDAWLLLETALALLGSDLAVRTVGVQPVWRLIRGQARGRRRQLEPREANRLRRAVQRAARRQLWTLRCLPQSLALAWLLARRGVPTELHFGVRSVDRAIEAHAWLECDGQSLDFDPDVRQRFQKLEPATARLP